MKYPVTDKLEIIRLVEESHLPVRRTPGERGISKSAFYRWCDLYTRLGEQGLEDRRCGLGRVRNRSRLVVLRAWTVLRCETLEKTRPIDTPV